MTVDYVCAIQVLLVTHIDHFVVVTMKRLTTEMIVNHKHLCMTFRACYYWNYCESQAFLHDLSSVLLLKLLWITNICPWAIERVTIEIILNHKHLCVIYRACYYWNYCESRSFGCDLSSVLLLKLLWITTIWFWLTVQ